MKNIKACNTSKLQHCLSARSFITCCLLCFIFISVASTPLANSNSYSHLETKQTNNMKTFYDFEAAKLNGETVSMNKYQGKTIIVVNTASKCGFTPQYKGLEMLYQKYKDQGLVILGFPCNQFGNQEPGSADEIKEFCEINYGVSFPLFAKVDVNGKNEHPIFKYLKSKLSGGILGSKIKWNFTKFVINSEGVPVKRYSPTTKPEKMEEYIKELLQK